MKMIKMTYKSFQPPPPIWKTELFIRTPCKNFQDTTVFFKRILALTAFDK